MAPVPTRLGIAAMAVSLAAAMATGGAQAQTLTMGLLSPPSSVDPHFYSSAPNKGFSAHIFDFLIDQGPTSSCARGWRSAGRRSARRCGNSSCGPV